MITTLKIILIVMIIIGFLGVVGSKDDNDLRNTLAGMTVVSTVSFVALSLLL